MSLHNFIHSYYVPAFIQTIRSIGLDQLDSLSSLLAQKISDGSRFFAFGNGGSEAIAGIIIQLLETQIPKHFHFDLYSPPNASEQVDNRNCKIFNERIERCGKKGDIVFLISASGDSLNINAASALCRRKGLVTLSFSANGKIAHGANQATHKVVFKIADQQVLEDATLAIINILIIFTKTKLTEKKYDLKEIRAEYLADLISSLENFDFTLLRRLTGDLLQSFENGHTIRIDAPDSRLLYLCAKHMEHNLKWDALSHVTNRPVNKVISGIPSCHYSGVANDGGEGYNHAIEIRDNLSQDDIEIIFAKSRKSKATIAALEAAERVGCKLFLFDFGSDSGPAKITIAQMLLHLTARVLNSRLLVRQKSIGLDTFKTQLRSDLALLRQKDLISGRLKLQFAQNND